MTTKGKVAILLSGGIDSSVAALLLLKQGYDLIAVTAKLINNTNDTCCINAQNIAKKLNIPHHVVDLCDTFQEEVKNYFINSYKLGETPNPCCVCNRKIKFGALLEYATNNLNCDYIATGHYAKIINKNNRYLLFPCKDEKKDQCYFLYNLTQEQLSKTILPLSDLTKDEIRKIAQENDLPSKSAKDSQDICFIQKPLTTSEYISQHLSSPKGDILLHPDNKKLGEHDGIYKYTLGQRKGLKVAYSEPLYVKDIDIKENKIYLATKSETLINEVKISDINNFDNIQNGEFRAKAKIRYNMPAKEVTVFLQNDIATIKFDEPVLIQSKGQIAVIYDLQDGHIKIGGTII